MAYNEGRSLFLLFFTLYTFSFFEANMLNEAMYQRNLIKALQLLFPGCFILKNDPIRNQGIPDILVLFRDRWAMLELKRTTTSRLQPNQLHYIRMFNEMSFAAFICPENEQEVLDDLQYTFSLRR